MAFLSSRSRYAINVIQEEDEVAGRLMHSGKEVMRMNRGDPPAYFPAPAYFIDAYIKALKERKVYYSSPAGVPELREAISRRYERLYGVKSTGEDVIVTNGVSEALLFLNSALINDGDSAVIFKPYYTQYLPDLEFYGGKAAVCDYEEDRGWEVDIDAVERSIKRSVSKDRKPKYMLITNPNNPTGTVLDKKTLSEIVEIAKNYRIFLVSDEIYDEITYNGAKFTSVSQVAKGVPHMILNGASKGYDSTGIRIGYAFVPGDDAASLSIKNEFLNLARVRLSANTPAQYAFAEAISNKNAHDRAISQMRSAIEKRVNLAAKLINESKYMDTVKPKGAFYLLPKLHMDCLKIKDDKEFVDKLLKEEDVWLTRGSGFGADNHARIVALAPEAIITQAMEKIEKFCRRHSKGA
jgi:alanine-synthesizing transaminase